MINVSKKSVTRHFRAFFGWKSTAASGCGAD